MSITGQTINYKKYRAVLKSMPAPIMPNQIPSGVKMNLSGLLAYAKEKGVQPGDLSDAEKNRFISGGQVESLQAAIQASVQCRNLEEWNTLHS